MPHERAPEATVLLVNHTSLQSGAELSLLELIDELPASINQVVACPEGPLADAVRERGVEVRLIPELTGSLRIHQKHTPRAVFELGRCSVALRRHAKDVGCDLVHANSVRAGLAAAIGLHRSGPPVVVFTHDCLPEHRLTSASVAAIRAGSVMVLANSDAAARPFRSRGGIPTRVVYEPTNLERFDPGRIDDTAAVRRRLGIEDGAKVLGIVGQVTPWKDQDTAIRMLARVRASHPEAVLLIVGEAKFVAPGTRYDNREYEAHLHKLVTDLGLNGEVRFLGQRGPDEVPEIMSAMDLLLMPSWVEPFGKVMVEAMAVGTPVLATNAGGPAEVIRDGVDGRLLTARAPEEWADAADELLRDPARRDDMGRAARLRARSFDGTSHAEAVMAAYREVLEPRPVGIRATAP